MKSLNLNYKIFIPAGGLLLLFIIFGAVAPSQFAYVTSTVKGWMGTNFAWLALGMAVVMTCILAAAAFSKFGKTKIGGPDAQPEYKTFTWIAMVLCGNIGIAMMFYAVVEPATFFTAAPAFWGVESGTDTAAEMAIAQTAFHWGGMTWVIDVFGGFAAFFLCMNYGLPFRPSTSLYPILKEKTFGWMGTTYDVIALIGIIGGIVTGFGFGVLQFSTGFSYNTGIEQSKLMYVIVVAVTVLVVALSSKRGFAKGLAWLSNFNAWLYLFIIVFLLVVGPTRQLLELFVGSAGQFIHSFVPMAFNGDFLGEGNGWNVDYTSFTWFWAFVYGPFTGMYLAKISRGRTIRAFLGAVLIVPTVFMLVWFCVWGGNAINLIHFMNIDIIEIMGEWGAPVANFVVLEHLPLKWLMIPAILVCILIGFITLVDALANVIAGMSSKSTDENTETSPMVRLFWILIIAGCTCVCLFVMDEVGMAALQSLTVTLGVPLCIISIAVCGSIIKLIKGQTQEYLGTPAGKADIERANRDK